MSKKSVQFNSLQSGFTFIEILVIFFILGSLMSVATFQVPRHFERIRDTQRKADLKEMKIALEDYANDNGCYPPENQMSNCTSSVLAPNVDPIRCDPQTNQPYRYTRSAECNSFELYTRLEVLSDPDIEALGCSGGCGPGGTYNYGVVGGKALLN